MKRLFIIGFRAVKKMTQPAVAFITIDKAPGKSDVEIIYPNGVRIKTENDPALVSQLIRLY